MDSHSRKLRQENLFKHVKNNTAKGWAESFIRNLTSQAKIERQRQTLVAPLIDQTVFKADYCRVGTEKRLMLIDYDALVPSFKNIAQSLEIIRELKSCLGTLMEDPRNIAALISERSIEQMEHTFSEMGKLFLTAEDGYCTRSPNESRWIQCTSDPDEAWWSRVQTILEYYTERTPGSWFERKHASYIWHYDRADPIFGERQAKECLAHVQDAIGSNYPVHAVAGQKRLQIRLRTVGQRQAIITTIKSILASDPTIEFVSIFVRSRDDQELFSSCRDVIGRLLGILLSSGGSPNSSTSSLQSLQTSQGFENPIPLHICAIGDTQTAYADQRIVNAKSLFRLLLDSHEQAIKNVGGGMSLSS